MKNGNITDFLDHLYLGEEIVFEYEDKKYFIQGWWAEDKSGATMVLDFVENLEFQQYFWKNNSSTMKACAEKFLATPLWDGKTFLQLQEKVIWSDW